MRQQLQILFVILCITVTISYKPGSKFCKLIECPTYTVLETTEGYEHRRYEHGSWVVLKQQRGKALFSSMRIRKYFAGANVEGKKIPDRVMAIIYNEKNDSQSYGDVVEFYSASKNLPQPTDKDIKIENKSFEIYASPKGKETTAQVHNNMVDSLILHNKTFTPYPCIFAVYEGGQEVWMRTDAD